MILFCSIFSFAQEKSALQISPYGGVSIPQSNFSNLSNQGYAFGLSIDKPLSSSFSLGIDVNRESLSLKRPFSYNQIPKEYLVTQSKTGRDFMNLNATFGPTFSFGKAKFQTLIYAKGGLSLFEYPSVADIFNQGKRYENTLFSMNNDTVTSWGATAGTRFSWSLSEQLSLFLQPQVVYSNAKFSYASKDITKSFRKDEDVTFFDPGTLVETRLTETEITPILANATAGFTFKLGKKNTKPKDGSQIDDRKNGKGRDTRNDSNEQECSEIFIVAPNSTDRINVAEKLPVFKWRTTLKVEKQKKRFQLYEVPNVTKENQKPSKEKYRLIYEEVTVNNQLKLSEKYRQLFQLEKGQQKAFMWQVSLVGQEESEARGCHVRDQDHFFAIVSPSSGIAEEVSIECKDPAYDQNGKLHVRVQFRGEVNVGTDSWRYTSITCNGGTIINAPLPSLPAVIQPGSPQVFTLDVEVPSSSAGLHLYFTVSMENVNDANDRETEGLKYKIPNCVCKSCENWEIDIQPQASAPYAVQGTQEDYLYIEHDIHAISPHGNIVMVDAELISYAHLVDNQKCMSCNKHKGQIGTFLPNPVSSIPLANHLSGGFQNAGLAKYHNQTGIVPFSTSGLPPSRNIWWKSITQLGVQFAPQKASLLIGVPKYDPSLAECCNEKFEICTRYTFTVLKENGQCIKCSKVICQTIVRDGETIKIINSNSKSK